MAPSTGWMGRTEDRVLDTLAAIETGVASDVALDRTFQSSRDLGPRERAVVSREVFGVIRARRRIDGALTRACSALGRKLSDLEPAISSRLRVLAWLALEGADEGALSERDAYAHKRIPGLFKRLRFEVPAEPTARSIAELYSLPDFFVSRVVSSHGLARAEVIAKALSLRAPLTLRVATPSARSMVAESLERELGAAIVPTSLSPWGLIVLEENAPVRATRTFEEGLIEPMDEGSQLVALAVGARPEDAVLDACAGAGGKTLALASMMSGGGRIVAIDPDPNKIEELRRRARRAKLSNVEAIVADLRELPEGLVGRFDRVLVDAPCTGSGTWRRAPDASWRVHESDLAKLVTLQASLFHAATRAVKDDGLVVFATCSVLDEENEVVTREVLGRDASLEPESLERTLGPSLGAELKATFEARVGPGPDERGPDGFYFAAVRKRARR